MIRVLIFNFSQVNTISQSVFSNLISQSLFSNLISQSLFSNLISQGYIIYAVDNGTVKELNKKLHDLNINLYLKTHLSSHSFSLTDHYSQIIIECVNQNIGIQDILIVDSDWNDIKIAQKFGFNICLCDINTVTNEGDIFEKISNSIKYYTDENHSMGKRTLFEKSINIVVPIMGDNRRFLRSRYGTERNLIEIMGKYILCWVLGNIQIDANYIFIIREHLCRLHKFDKMLKSMYPNCTIIKSERGTEGNACSILLAEQYINNTNPLIVLNDNQWLSWNVEEYITDFLLNEKSILQAITFKCCGDNSFHYIKTSDENDKHIRSIYINKPVNEYALTDVYFWRRGEDYIKYTHRMNSQNKRLFGEFCTTLVTNEVLDDTQNKIVPEGSVIHRLCDKYFIFREDHHIPEFEQWYLYR